MANKPKYKPRFAKQLRDGLRANGMSIEECCVKWGVSRATWYLWIKEIPKFAEAAEIAETHAVAYWAERYRKTADGSERGNAGLLVFAAKNVMGWADKTETHVTHDEQVQSINITVLPSYEERLALASTKVIEHEGS